MSISRLWRINYSIYKNNAEDYSKMYFRIRIPLRIRERKNRIPSDISRRGSWKSHGTVPLKINRRIVSPETGSHPIGFLLINPQVPIGSQLPRYHLLIGSKENISLNRWTMSLLPFHTVKDSSKRFCNENFCIILSYVHTISL